MSSKTDIEAAKKQRLTEVKNYQRCAGQIKMELDWLYDWILGLAIFVRYLQKVYNN